MILKQQPTTLQDIKNEYYKTLKEYWNEEYNCLEESIEFEEIYTGNKIYKEKLPEVLR